MGLSGSCTPVTSERMKRPCHHYRPKPMRELRDTTSSLLVRLDCILVRLADRRRLGLGRPAPARSRVGRGRPRRAARRGRRIATAIARRLVPTARALRATRLTVVACAATRTRLAAAVVVAVAADNQEGQRKRTARALLRDSRRGPARTTVEAPGAARRVFLRRRCSVSPRFSDFTAWTHRPLNRDPPAIDPRRDTPGRLSDPHLANEFTQPTSARACTTNRKMSGPHEHCRADSHVIVGVLGVAVIAELDERIGCQRAIHTIKPQVERARRREHIP